MKIAENSVVSIDYTLKNDAGSVLDTSEGRAPLDYLHGHKNIIPGLESALTGHSVDDTLQVTIAPEDAYGTHDESLILEVSKQQFNSPEPLQVGMQFQANTPTGPRIMTIKKIEGDTVTVDGNHPLADTTLHFDVTVKSVREATQEEIDHGHIHSHDHDHGDGCGSDNCGCSGH